MRHSISFGCLLGLLSAATSPAHAQTPAPTATAASAAAPTAAEAAAAKKAVQALTNAIRYGKDNIGKKYLGCAHMSAALLGDTWTQMTAAQQQQFQANFEQLVVGTAFPKGRQMFQYLDALLFAPARGTGAQVVLPSTIVIHRNLKKTEIPIEWVVAQEAGSWRVVDIISMQESTCAGIREEEVVPLLKEGGVNKLLQVLQQKVAQLPAAKK